MPPGITGFVNYLGCYSPKSLTLISMLIIIAIYIHITGGMFMKTVQMTLDDDLVDAVDKMAKRLKTTRSAFTRQALRNALKQVGIQQMEAKHKKGYEKKPVNDSEFSIWESEQEWID